MIRNLRKGRCTMQVTKKVLLVLSVMVFATAAWANQATPLPVEFNGESVAPVVGWYLHENVTNTDPAGDNYGRLRVYPLTDSGKHGLDFAMPYQIFYCNPDSYNNGACQWTQAEVDAKVLNYLDEASAAGVKLLIDLKDFDIIKNNLPELARRVNLVKDNPAVMGYYLSDEPGMQTGCPSAAQLKAAYDTIKANDPDHPVYGVATEAVMAPNTYNYLESFDVFYRDIYPITNTMSGDDLAVNYTALIEKDVADIAAATSGRVYKLNYSILRQAFDREAHNGKIYPTALQYRYLVYAPISVGVAGDVATFMFSGYSFEDNAPSDTYREDIVYPTLDEYLRIRDLLAQGSAGLTATSTVGDVDFIAGEDLDKVTYVFCGSSSDAVLIAVNNTNGPLSNVDFHLTGLDSAITKAYNVSEDSTLDFFYGTFQDSFDEGYQVKIYRFRDWDWANVPMDCTAAKEKGYTLSADVNGDCYVNLADFAIIATDWLVDCSQVPFDINCGGDTPWFN